MVGNMHNEFNEQIRQTFIDESLELVNQLEDQLLLLEGNRSDMEAVNRVFRIMHTLKGNGSMFGFAKMSEFTHHMENIYDKIRNSQLELSDDIFSITLLSIDHIKSLIFEGESDSVSDTHSQLLSMLDGLALGISVNTNITALTEKKEKVEQRLYYIYWAPHEDIMMDGSNPLFFVQDVHALGSCACVCNASKIPDPLSFSVEKCYLIWHLLLATSKPLSEIEEVFMFLQDNSQPQIIDICKYTLSTLSDEDVLTFKSLAQSSSKIEDYGELTSKHANQQKKTDLENKGDAGSLRVTVHKIETLLNLVSELITVQAELSLLVQDCEDEILIESIEQVEHISRELRNNAFSISLMPIDQSLTRFQKLVADVSQLLNKKVVFTVEGGDTELDKTIIEHIIDPIMHILRNSIDHGIELPEKRLAAGKPEHGTILFKAFCSGPFVILQISDDGAGLNLRKIREIGIKRQIITESDILSDEELRNLILAPGFSTADKVSEVSGRGVGMDVVHQRIKEVKGELFIDSIEGSGTTMTLRLPLTISIVDTLLLKVENTHLLIPLSNIHQCFEVAINHQANIDSIIINDEYLPVLFLSHEFGHGVAEKKDYRIVSIPYQNQHIALLVDEIIGQYQAVIKPLGLLYRKHEFISGASILGNGEIALVIDPIMLIKQSTQRQKVSNAKAVLS